MNMRNLKSQFWSFDVIFAVIIFSFAITVLAFTWFNINNQLSLGYGNGPGIMQLQLQSFAQELFSPGIPANWQSSVNTANTAGWDSISIGISNSQGGAALSTSKIYAFESMSNRDYQATKQALGLGFDYYVTIRSSPALGSGVNINIGSNPAVNGALTVYVDKAAATMNGVPVIVQMILWTNTTFATS